MVIIKAESQLSIGKQFEYFIFICCLCLIPLNSTMIVSALPSLSEYFQINISSLTFYLTIPYLMVNIILQIIAGKMGDVYGKYIIINIAHLILLIGVALALIKANFQLLVAGRILMAIGGTILMPNMIALIYSKTKNTSQSYMLGLLNGMMGFSASIGPLLGGFLTKYWTWDSIFLVNLPIIFLSWFYSLKSSDLIIYKRFSKLSAISNKKNLKEGKENYYKRNFALASISIFVHNVVFYGVLFGMPFWLSSLFGFDSLSIGQTLLIMTMSMTCAIFIEAILHGKIQNLSTLISGTLLLFLSLSLLYLALNNLHIIYLMLALLLLGFSVGMVYVPSQKEMLASASESSTGFISGLSLTIRYSGCLVGILLLNISTALFKEANALEISLFCISTYLVLIILNLVIFWFLIKEKNSKKSIN